MEGVSIIVLVIIAAILYFVYRGNKSSGSDNGGSDPQGDHWIVDEVVTTSSSPFPHVPYCEFSVGDECDFENDGPVNCQYKKQDHNGITYVLANFRCEKGE